ncbi:MAG: hypothetical protein A2Y91_00820, partial [Chloroflexi bacterium RBG_13_54_8]
IREVAKRLALKGHEVTVLGMKYWEGEDIIYDEGVRLWGVCPPQRLHVNGHRSARAALYFSWKVLSPLLKEKFDVIDCQNFPYFPCFSAKLASLFRGSTLIVTWHEVWNDYWFEYLGKKGLMGKAVERMVAHLSSRPVANSEATRRGLEKIGGGKGVRVISSGVNLEKAGEMVDSPECSDVLFVGRLSREKNVDLLVKAVSCAKRDMPGIRCLIVGDGPERKNLESLISQLDLEGSICLKGFEEREERVFAWMKASKVLVLPSTREGLGLVVLEANACGLPVITVKHPLNAACDLISDGENGFKCELSEQDMAEKILMTLKCQNNWKARCPGFAREYDWNAIADSLEGIYASS